MSGPDKTRRTPGYLLGRAAAIADSADRFEPTTRVMLSQGRGQAYIDVARLMHAIAAKEARSPIPAEWVREMAEVMSGLSGDTPAQLRGSDAFEVSVGWYNQFEAMLAAGAKSYA